MDQDGNICRCHCHSTFVGKEPDWECYCRCNTGKINPKHKPSNLEKRVTELEKNLQFQMEVFKANWTRFESIKSIKPHVCPVCIGSGNDMFYTPGNFEKNPCRVCEGKGIVWG